MTLRRAGAGLQGSGSRIVSQTQQRLDFPAQRGKCRTCFTATIPVTFEIMPYLCKHSAPPASLAQYPTTLTSRARPTAGNTREMLEAPPHSDAC